MVTYMLSTTKKASVFPASHCFKTSLVAEIGCLASRALNKKASLLLRPRPLAARPATKRSTQAIITSFPITSFFAIFFFNTLVFLRGVFKGVNTQLWMLRSLPQTDKVKCSCSFADKSVISQKLFRIYPVLFYQLIAANVASFLTRPMFLIWKPSPDAAAVVIDLICLNKKTRKRANRKPRRWFFKTNPRSVPGLSRLLYLQSVNSNCP